MSLFESARGAAVDAARGFLCAAGAAQGIYNDVVGKTNPLYDASPGGRYGRGLERALRGFCPLPSPGGASGGGGAGDFWPELPPPPFEGGQCPKCYRVAFTAFGAPGVSSQEVWGPISEAGKFVVDEVQDSCVIRATGFTQSGQPLTITPAAGACSNIEFTGLVTCDGSDDDCGDPPVDPDTPPVFPDPAPPPTPFPPPSPGPDIDWPGLGPITPIFAPIVGIIYVDADANVKIPVTVNVNLPDVDLDFDFNFDINISDPTEPPKPLPDKPGDRDDDRPEKPDCPPPPECDDEPEEKEPDEPLSPGTYAAAIVTTVEVDDTEQMKATTIWQDEAPPIYAPNCGYLHIAYGKSEEEQQFGVDIPLKKLVQVHPNPVPEAPIFRAVVVPARGFKLPFESLGYAVISAPKCNCP